MSAGSGRWPTIWAAVGALAAVAAVLVSLSSGSETSRPVDSTLVVPSTGSASPAREPAQDCTCIGVVRVSPGKAAQVHSRPSSDSAVVTTLRTGTKVRVECTVEGTLVKSSVTGSVSSTWDRIDDGYIADVLLDTVAQRQVDSC